MFFSVRPRSVLSCLPEETKQKQQIKGIGMISDGGCRECSYDMEGEVCEGTD